METRVSMGGRPKGKPPAPERGPAGAGGGQSRAPKKKRETAVQPSKPAPTRKRRRPGRPPNPTRLRTAAGWLRIAVWLGCEGLPEVAAARAAMRGRQRPTEPLSAGEGGEPPKAVCSALARAVWAVCCERGVSMGMLRDVERAHQWGRTSVNLAVLRLHDACLAAIRAGRGDTTRAAAMTALLLCATEPPLSELPAVRPKATDQTGRRLSGPERIRRLAKRIHALATNTLTEKG